MMQRQINKIVRQSAEFKASHKDYTDGAKKLLGKKTVRGDRRLARLMIEEALHGLDEAAEEADRDSFYDDLYSDAFEDEAA